jgi:Domain of unknown function (DUF4340)
MSRTGVIIAIVCMLALAATAWLVLPRGNAKAGKPADTGPPRLLDFTPSDVAELIIKHADGKRESIFKTADGWRLRTTQSDSTNTPSWPIAGAQVRGMLTILHNLAPVAQAPDDSLRTDALTVCIRLDDTAEQTLLFDTRSIGGRRLVQAGDSSPVYLDKPVYEALTNPGPMGWRESNLLRSVGIEVSRLSIESAQGKLKLARIRNVWRLREPVRAPADADAVDQLLKALSSLTALRWVDNPSERVDADIANFASALRFTIERDRRTVDKAGESKIETDIQLLTVGGKANVAGNERYVLLGASGLAATIAANQLLEFEVDPAVYASRTAIDVNRSQIGSIEITQPGEEAVTVTRTLDGWKLEPSGGVGRIVPDEQVRTLLDLLMQRQADRVALEDVGADAGTNSASVLIELFGFNHQPLGDVRVTQADTTLMLLSDGLARDYFTMDIPDLLAAPTK